MCDWDKIFRWGTYGYELYKEIHHNPINQIIHGIGMIIVVFSVYLGLPAILNIHNNSAFVFSSMITMMFLSYYMIFDHIGAILSAVIYLPLLGIVYNSPNGYLRPYRCDRITASIILFTLSILVQEIIGHTIFEQKNSDLCQILNSITIAPLFGARSLFDLS